MTDRSVAVASGDVALAPMTDKELSERDNLIAVVKQEIGAFIRVGIALIRIRDEKLYREKHETFELFCRDVFGWTGRYCRLQIQATEVIQSLQEDGNKLAKAESAADNADVPATLPMPQTEAQARPLAKLPTKKRREVWKKAVESAPEGNVTAEHVAVTVKEHVADEERRAVGQGIFTCPEDDCSETFQSPHWHCICGKHGHWSKLACSCGRKIEPAMTSGLCEWEIAERAKIPGWPIDGLGIPIPDHMRPVFTLKAEFHDVNQAMRQLQRRIDALAKGPAGAHLRRHLSFKQDGDGSERHVCMELLNARKVLEYGEPYTLCPYCYKAHPGVINQNCNACKGSGWVPEDAFERAPESDRNAVSRLVPKQTMAA